jgi:hypothetical protein
MQKLRSYADVVREHEKKINSILHGISEGPRTLKNMKPGIATHNGSNNTPNNVAHASIRYYTHPNKSCDKHLKQDNFYIRATNYSAAQNNIKEVNIAYNSKENVKTEPLKHQNAASFSSRTNTVDLWNQFSCSYPVIHVLDVMLTHLFHDWCNSMRQKSSEQRIPATVQLKKVNKTKPSDNASKSSKNIKENMETLILVERKVGFMWGKLINEMMAAHRVDTSLQKLQNYPDTTTQGDIELPDLEEMVMHLAKSVIIEDSNLPE